MQLAFKLLTDTNRNKHAYLFAKPVDVVLHNIPDYPGIIENPMDLGTIMDKVRAR